MNAAEVGDPQAGAGHERLAAPLVQLATRVRAAVEPARLRDAAVALRAFVARPSAAGYLGAVRALRATARRQKLSRLEGVSSPRLAEENLALVVSTAGLPVELRDLLSMLPPDAATMRRFGVIGQLLTAHALLAAHAETALLDLHEHVGQPSPRVISAERRRTRRARH